MSQKLYLIISGAVFLLVGVMHLLRLINDVPIVVGTTNIPMAISYVGFPAALVLCIWAWNSLRARGR